MILSGIYKDGSNKVLFEDALDKAGFGLYSYLLTALTGLSIISMACIVYGSTIVAPTSACELETTSAQLGLIVAAPILGLILGAVLWGYLADTRGRRKMLLTSFLTAAVVNAISSISVNWVMLMILQFFAAILASGQYSIAIALLSESVPQARRNLMVLIVASIFMLSQGVMSLLAIPIIPLDFSYYISGLDIYWNPWRTVLLVFCAPSLICFVCQYFMQESPKFAFSKGDEVTSLEILRVIYRINNRKSLIEFPVKGLIAEKSTVSEGKKGISKLFKPPLLKYLIIISVLSIFLKISGFMVWLPTILNQFVQILRTGEGKDFTLCEIIRSERDASVESNLPPCALDETSLLLVFAVGCLQSVFNICVSLVVNKTGRRNIAIAIASVCGVSGILINLVPNAIASALLFMVFLLGMVLMGLYTAISVALFPTSLRAVAMGITMTGSRIALVPVVQLLNWLLDTNCELGFYIFASLIVLSAGVAALLPDDRQLKKPEEPESAEESKAEMQQRENPLEAMPESKDFITREQREIENQRL